MKLTTVLGSVNNNLNYYCFIPKQIKFWKKYNINFIAVFVGNKIPNELEPYANNILLWNKNLDIHGAFVGQNIRLYVPAILDLPDDELVMITDMDMLPLNNKYYTDGLEDFKHEDFIYYREIDEPNKEIFMCYNAAHPKTWRKIFNINNISDIENKIYESYTSNYTGIPGKDAWATDQKILYKHAINYPHLKILKRPIKRLETNYIATMLMYRKQINFKDFDDVHFHRSFINNFKLIQYTENEFFKYN
jgi:hypothetical protein